MTKERDCSKNPYNRTRHDSKELVYMYAKICNMEKNTIIGRYKVLEYLGSGGFGIVYKCFDSVLMSNVAIKFLDPIITREPKKFHRIKREINISRKITDDKIVKIYSMEKYYDVIYLVMEFIEGIPLSDIIKDKKYEWKEFKPILIEILHGLKLLHKNGIIHRDLKPGNIMVLKNGDIKIVDFGLAKEILDAEKTSTTEEFSGTAEFVSPEQVEGLQLDTRSDIYQVGLLIFKVLSNQHPLHSSSTMELLVKYITAKPRKISSVTKNLPKYAWFVTDKMLERDKSNRFNNVDEIIEILEKEHISFTTQIASVTNKNKTKLIFGSIILIIAAFILFFNSYYSGNIDKISINGGQINAQNKFNRILWEKDFAPAKILTAFIMPVIPDQGEKTREIKKEMIFCLLKNNTEKTLPANVSINSTIADNSIVSLNTDGSIISKNSFFDFFHLQHYDHERMFEISGKIIKKDLNKDKKKDVLFLVKNGLSTNPFGLIYFKDSKPLVYTSPGSFSYNIINSDENSLSFTVFGTRNLLSGLNSFSEIELKKACVMGVPNLSTANNQNFSGYTFFLPSSLKIENDRWKESGIVDFINTNSGEKVSISKEHKISVIKEGKEDVYSDPFSKIQKFNILFNTYYKEKTLYRNYSNAEKIINRIINLKFENPYLNSALYYLKGEIQIKQGNYQKSELSLKKSLLYYPENPRIAGLYCYIPFFKGKPLESIEMQEKLFSTNEILDGLANGTKVFKVLMYLASGLHTKAEEFTAKVILNSPKMRYTLIPIMAFYNGKLEMAEKMIEIGLKNPSYEIGNAAYRLLCANIYILNDSNLDRARFFLEDILKYSERYGHLSELSLAYLLAKDERISEAEKMADLSLETVLKYSKGYFSTKALLFFEYYIYGKTMEIVGNTKKAINGYKKCISEVPTSYLAILSKERVTVLESR